jgi:hypothetical protein
MTDRNSPRLAQLCAEANYHRQRLARYHARLYAGGPLSVTRLEDFERASDAAAARLGRARDEASLARRQGER